MADLEKKYEACVVSGVEGASLYLNNYRIAGPKPWGGGQTAYEWSRVTMDDLVQAVPELRALRESHDALHNLLGEWMYEFGADCRAGDEFRCKNCLPCRSATAWLAVVEADAALAKAEALQKGESISEEGDYK